jgi:hypothetical protein
VGSPQTLSEADRRIVAVWAADCAERVLGLFEAEAPGDSRPRDAIARLRAFARGELGVGEARRRFVAHAAAREVSAPAAVAAARAAGQAASIPHMGAHALGADAYAAKAAGLAAPPRRRCGTVRPSACGQPSSMTGDDPSGRQRDVRRQRGARHSGLPAPEASSARADCPNDVPVVIGNAFTCELRDAGRYTRAR